MESLGSNYVPGTVLGTGIEAKNEIILLSVLRVLTSSCGKTYSNSINECKMSTDGDNYKENKIGC